MSDNVKQKKRWFLKAELVILACAICIGIIKLVTVDIDSTKATFTKQVVRIKPNSADSSKETPRIEVIGISGSGESFVIVEGKLAHEGDIINGFRILKIYPDRVEFEKNGKIVAGK